ncbi:MAG TPA: HAMP domain-containing protein [Candidatus Binatia bacterium]|jgi:HAMP domain-containing protein
MAEAPAPAKNGKLLSVVSRWQDSLKWRIAYAYGGLIVILGLFVIGVVYQSMSRAVRAQIDRRVATVAAGLGDAAAGAMSKQPFELRGLVYRYSRLDGVAYVFVEDRNGDVSAHSLKSFPLDLLHSLSPEERRQPQRVIQTYRGKTVYEARAPISEGQLGVVHLAIWGDGVEDEVKHTVLPVVALVLLAVIATVVLAVLLAHGIIYPIRRLTDAAGKISTGDLEAPIVADSTDEIGELARSLERMRASLKTAIWRLSRAAGQ